MTARDGAWLDRMYNNRERVPDHPSYFRRWAELSEAARAALPCELDIRYGTEPGETLDVFRAPARHAPVLVFIHGGYWRSLDKRDHSFVARPFVDAGACVVIPNYALCPAVTVPQITLQIVHALAWTWRNVRRYEGDPSRITVAGNSAGGQLAAMMLACLWQVHHAALPPGLVRNAMAISALHDLQPLMHTPFLQPALQLTEAQVQQASPSRVPAPSSGTLYSLVGGDESAEYLRQNDLIRAAWGSERVPVCEVIPGRNHFSMLDAFGDPAHRVHRLALELLT